MMREGGAWRWRAAAIGVAVNGAALTLLALSGHGFRLPQVASPPDLALDLVRRAPTAPRLRERAALAAAHSPPRGPARPRTERRDVDDGPAALSGAPAPPPTSAPSPGGPTPAAEGRSPSAAWRVSPSAPAGLHGFGGGLLGCGHDYRNLTQAQQAACDHTLADARTVELPHVDAIPGVKRGYYDAVVAKKETDRFGAFRDLKAKQDNRVLAGRRTNVDINIGYHCTFKFGAGAADANKAAGKKIGFPPCPIRLPGADPPPP